MYQLERSVAIKGECKSLLLVKLFVINTTYSDTYGPAYRRKPFLDINMKYTGKQNFILEKYN